MTAEELERFEVFATLDRADRERICQAAADVSLNPGEFAVYEGYERSLFGVLGRGTESDAGVTA